MFKNYEFGFWVVLIFFVCLKFIDVIFEGVNFVKVLIIILDKFDIIVEKILKEFDRGVIGFYGVGMWIKIEKNVLLCVVKRYEVSCVKNFVKSID